MSNCPYRQRQLRTWLSSTVQRHKQLSLKQFPLGFLSSTTGDRRISGRSPGLTPTSKKPHNQRCFRCRRRGRLYVYTCALASSQTRSVKWRARCPLREEIRDSLCDRGHSCPSNGLTAVATRLAPGQKRLCSASRALLWKIPGYPRLPPRRRRKGAARGGIARSSGRFGRAGPVHGEEPKRESHALRGKEKRKEERRRELGRELGPYAGGTLVELLPETGRMHQIRAQTTGRGFPIRGDRLYGARLPLTPPPSCRAIVSLPCTRAA